MPSKEVAVRAAKGATPFDVEFSAPVYISRWLSETEVLVGGGGGRKFGMANQLLVLGVSQPRSGFKWVTKSTFDLGGDIAWCCSRPFVLSSGEAIFAVSHVDGVSVMSYHKGRLHRFGRVELVADMKDADKKCVAISSDTVFAAQDDCTIKIIARHHLRTTGLIGKIDGRISDMDCVSFGAKRCLLAVAAQDKLFRLYSVTNNTACLQQTLSGAELGYSFALKKSSLRLCHFVPGSHRCCVGVYNSDAGKTLFSIVEYRNKGRTVADGEQKCTTVTVTADAATSVDIVSGSGIGAVGSVAGSVALIDEGSLRPRKVLKDLHSEPVSSVSLNPSGTIMCSSDISQHVRFTIVRQAHGLINMYTLVALFLAIVAAIVKMYA